MEEYLLVVSNTGGLTIPTASSLWWYGEVAVSTMAIGGNGSRSARNSSSGSCSATSATVATALLGVNWRWWLPDDDSALTRRRSPELML